MLYKAIEMKHKIINEQDSPVLLSIKLDMVVLTLNPVEEILWCDHSNESCRAPLSCCLFVMLDKVVLI